jgi:hypothetical protein
VRPAAVDARGGLRHHASTEGRPPRRCSEHGAGSGRKEPGRLSFGGAVPRAGCGTIFTSHILDAAGVPVGSDPEGWGAPVDAVDGPRSGPHLDQPSRMVRNTSMQSAWRHTTASCLLRAPTSLRRRGKAAPQDRHHLTAATATPDTFRCAVGCVCVCPEVIGDGLKPLTMR